MTEMMTISPNPLQSQDRVVKLQQHIERLLTERKSTRKEIETLRELAERQQETIEELRRTA